MSNEVLTALIASGVAIIGAITSFILNWLKAKSIQVDLSSIKEVLGRSDKLYYIVCPNCKTKIYLSRVSIEEEIAEDGERK
nr:MAG TPA: alpha-aminoadipate carrier protein [Caudoviricetes sp.]